MPPEIFAKAINYLYLSETRSTNAIENETASTERAELFMAQLRHAGTQSFAEAFADKALDDLQECFINPRSPVDLGMRGPDTQNWVGHTVGMSERVDYPCPCGNLLPGMLEGWRKSVETLSSPIAQATVASFAFVFIHPYMDGNGRISRYLIHDIYARSGLVPAGLIFPVSAVILKNLTEYKSALEAHSKPILNLSNHELDGDGELHILNPDVLEPLWRYPVLTDATLYLQRMTEICAEKELPAEIHIVSALATPAAT